MQANETPKLSERQRKVNLDKLDAKTFEDMSVMVGKKLGDICQEAQEKANKIANIYGFKVVVAIQFLDPKTEEILTPSPNTKED